MWVVISAVLTVVAIIMVSGIVGDMCHNHFNDDPPPPPPKDFGHDCI